MQYDDALEHIYSRERFGMKLGLTNIRSLLEKLGNPHENFDFIHVTGTNGKGSVCAMIYSILQQQGYKVGLYTSPHLVEFEERIQVNNRKISKKEIAKIFQKINPFLEYHTFFEVATALAFEYFNEKNVDYVVAEVGMGGRLDATNVITPLVSVITNVTLEHTHHLGATVRKIAYEKAGIIKNDIPTVTAATGEALDVIKEVCAKKDSRLSVVELNKDIRTNLNGYFQLLNASTCLKAIEILREEGVEISESSVSKGLMKVVWPGRMHFVADNILLDCAHNPAAIDVIVKEIKKLKYDKLIVLAGILKDKDIKNMIKSLNIIADNFVIVEPHTTRAAKPKFISKFVKKDYNIIPDVKEALEFAKSITKKNDLLLVTGSIYTVGEVMQQLI